MFPKSIFIEKHILSQWENRVQKNSLKRNGNEQDGIVATTLSDTAKDEF